VDTDVYSIRAGPVLAVADGEVLYVREPTGSKGGIIVVKAENGTIMRYPYLSAVYVSPGQGVQQGQCIGALKSFPSGRTSIDTSGRFIETQI